MKATITKLITNDKQARIYILDNTDLIQELVSLENFNIISREALSTTFTLSSLLCGLLKDKQRVSIQINTSTSSKYIRCDVDSHGNVRGYASEDLIYNKENFNSIPELIGNKGIIKVTKDIGMGSLFTGIVDMPYKNIVDDFSNYFLKSDQVETAFRYYYKEENSKTLYSRGILFQPLPFCNPDLLSNWLDYIDRNKCLFDNSYFNPNTILPNTKVVGTQQIQLFCGCSREMFLGLLFSLGNEDLTKALNEKQNIETVCNICGKKYIYDENDISLLVNG